MYFEIVGEIGDIELISKGPSLRERARLKAQFGAGRWRKLKGTATVRLRDGTVCRAEVHWYEAHGLGRKKFKIKRLLE
jgi:outer membrane receptor for monomeric catechols